MKKGSEPHRYPRKSNRQEKSECKSPEMLRKKQSVEESLQEEKMVGGEVGFIARGRMAWSLEVFRFILSEMGCQWMVMSRGVTWYDLHFRRITPSAFFRGQQWKQGDQLGSCWVI